jgi:hypothetical protein
MRKVTLIAFACACLAGFVVFIGSCMDRKPGPVCPVPTEVTVDENMVKGFDGVDMIVVIDNSQSMAEEQDILATSFITLINSLAKPTAEWPYPPVENMRIAIVSSDLGLQYGEDGSTEGFPYTVDVTTCTDDDPKGDDGEFYDSLPSTIEIVTGQIACDEDDPVQCPPDFNCSGGVCTASENPYTVNCPNDPSDEWFETAAEDPNSDLAMQISCMSKLGTKGCGVEQQLQAAVRGLERYQDDFLVDNHLLAVLIVSDEEDCSIEDPGLFETDEWISGTGYEEDDPNSGLLNVACNYPQSNEDDFLFSVDRFRAKYVELKEGMASAVIFAAIVGVPTGNDSPCQGRGSELGGCLDDDDMQIEIAVFEDTNGNFYKHFANSCTREENGVSVTEARPGRRYVKVAQSFGTRGYIYSICNADWSPAMEDIAKVIAENLTPQCYAKHLEWKLVAGDEQPGDCETCGVALCDVVAVFEYPVDKNKECQDIPVEDESLIVEEPVKDDSGQTTSIKVYCPLPKLPAELDCDSAKDRWADDLDTVGWYYCQNSDKENFEQACQDGIDNDCKDACGGTGVDCENTCMNEIKLTKEALSLSRGSVVAVQCLQQFTFEDKNCQENSYESCNDELDNDGNKIWDCNTDMSGDDAHFPDPHCCPMTKGSDNKCDVDKDAFKENCPDQDVNDPEGACRAAALAIGCEL